MKLVIDFILIAGIILNLLMLFLLIKPKIKELHKKILIVFFIFTLFVNLHAYACLHQLYFLYKVSFLFDFVIFFIMGPLLLVYIRSSFENPVGLIKASFVHFIPTIIFTGFLGIPLLLSVVLSSFEPEWLVYIDENQFGLVIARDVYFLFYVKLSLDALKAYKAAITSNYSNLSNKDYRWMGKLLYGCVFFISMDIVTRILDFYDIDRAIVNTEFFTMYSIIAVAAYLGYYGVNQSRILLPDFLLYKKEIISKKTNSLSSYTEVEIQALVHTLEDVIHNNKSYLNPDLNLTILSEQVGITDKKLSTLLNCYMNTTFYDYINSFRLESVKRTLLSDRYTTHTLLAIALESGFNSKASFNRVFKRETGLSPSQFIREKSGLNGRLEAIDVDF